MINETLQKRYDNLKELFLENCKEERKEPFKKLVEFAETKTEFLTAPASTKYHLNREHGLLEHSVNVTEYLLKLRLALDPTIPIESCIVAGLFHDFGKVGIPGKPFYVPGIPTPKQKKFGYPASDKYSINPNLLHMPHAHRSVYLILPHMMLTENEYQAIIAHDGVYIEDNKAYAHKECKLLILLHYADYWSCQGEPIEDYLS